MESNESRSLTIKPYDILGNKISMELDTLFQNIEIENLDIEDMIIDNTMVSYINGLPNLKNINFYNCVFSFDSKIRWLKNVQIEECKFDSIKNLFNNMELLSIENCKNIDIEDIVDKDLKTLRIVYTNINNLKKIEDLIKIQNLYLNEVTINADFNIDKLKYLKKVDFSGSKALNKEELMEKFRKNNIEIIFSNRYENIG